MEKLAPGFEDVPTTVPESVIEPNRLIDLSPEHPKSEVPVLLAPGWSEGPVVLRGSINTLLNENRRVISIDHPRHSVLEDVPLDFEFGTENKTYPPAGYAKALNILQVIADRGLEQVDVIAHSQGGIDVAIAASLRPDMFRNIVFVNPGGMSGPDTFPKLFRRFMKKLPKDSLMQQREGIKYAFHNVRRATAEAKAISRSQIQEALKGLHRDGVGVAVMAGFDDPLFKMGDIQKTLEGYGGYLDGFASVKGGHDELHRNPDKYTAAAEQLLTNLEEKARNKEQPR